LSADDWTAFINWNFQTGMKQSSIREPSETIAFGEKASEYRHRHMDFYQGGGNDLDVIEQGRHSRAAVSAGSAGSNFAFVDGSVRFLRFGSSLYPINLWGVTDQWRRNSVAPLP
jgi:prepilin-type processing-associated H-X9-DG protein